MVWNCQKAIRRRIDNGRISTVLTTLLFSLCLFHPCTCFAKPLSAAHLNDTVPYWVYFIDKEFNGQAERSDALNNAENRLNERCRERRSRVKTGALIDVIDLAVDKTFLDSVSAITGCPPRTVSRWLNAASYDFQPSLVDLLLQLSFVSRIEPVRSFTRHFPEDFYFTEDDRPHSPDRDDHRFDYGNSYIQNAFLNIPELHDRDYLGEGILIGLTDTGFNNLGHECFENLDIVAAYDFVNDDDDVDDGDDLGTGRHGTQTLSVLAGFAPGDLIGIAPEASYVLAKTECTLWERMVEEDYWIAAVEWMDELGVDIVSSSLSYMSWYDYEDMDGNTAPITIVADRAVEVGMVVVNAMGNTGQSDYPIDKMGAPADGNNVLGIGAMRGDSTRTAFSSLGPSFDGRIKPDFTTLGQRVRVASPTYLDVYGSNNGTSFSTPAIAGLCALLIQVNPHLTPILLRDILREVAHNNEEPDTLIGWGIPDGLAAFELIQPDEIRMDILLEAGWSTISRNVDVFINQTIPEIFEDIVINNNLLLVKDALGNFYLPSYLFNNIPTWNLFRGYQVNVIEMDTLTFYGLPVYFTQPVPLLEGWQIVAYLPDFELPVEQAFASIVDEEALIRARDSHGNFYLPDRGFSNMPDLRPGKGYHIRTDREIELFYPRRRTGEGVRHIQPDPVVFRRPPASADGMSILLYAGENIFDGDEIGFFNAEEKLVGSGVFSSGLCGVAIWGDEECEFPSAELYSRTRRDIVLPDLEWIEGSQLFEPGELAVLSVSIGGVTDVRDYKSFSISATPNPFNSRIMVSYSDMPSGVIEVKVYDLSGRRVDVSFSRLNTDSDGTFIIDGSGWSCGGYIVQISSGQQIRRTVVYLVK
ncbi:S8 family serine peptidase [bacterium]|nr:S8 family serine peptidase [bacterium]